MAKFQEIKFYSQKKEKGYQLLPFKFSELDPNNYLLTGQVSGQAPQTITLVFPNDYFGLFAVSYAPTHCFFPF
jgi:hypothetical protein